MYLRALRLELATRRGDSSAASDLEAARRLNQISRDPQWIEPLQVNAAQLAIRAGRYADARAAVVAGLNAVRESSEGLRMTRLVWVGLMVEAEAAEQVRALGGDFDREPTEALTRDLETAQRMPAQWAEGAPYAALARAELNRSSTPPTARPPTRPRGTTRRRLRRARAAVARRLRAPARRRGARAAGDRRPPATPLPPPRAPRRGDGRAAARARGRGARAARAPRSDADEATAPAAASPRPADQLGLTPREHEVLLLVAEGRTNREIGATLFMSEKTASVHVSRILAKLDVSGRVEAAAVAHRLGLTSPEPAQRR